jgi:parallel beta-helix repeat protein
LLKRTFSGIVLMLLLTGMLTLAFNVQPVKASGTVYIKADGSIDPPDAPISSVDNITYTLTGNITSDADGIVVERNNIVIDGAGYTVQGPDKGISLSGRSNVTIKNTNIKDCGVGIWLDGSSNNSIVGNNITNNRYGIELYISSSNNSIVGNNIANNSYYGIWLEWWSNYNSIVGNVFVNDGLAAWDFYGNVVVDNLVNGKPLVYLEDVSDIVVEDAGQVLLVNCNRIKVENLNLSNTAVGVQLWRTSYTTIAGNNIANNSYYGIRLYECSNNSIVGNKITNNSGDGIFLHGSSNYNSIVGNSITNSRYGIFLEDSSNNSISQNNITANNWNGIELDYSSDNSIVGNIITDNSYYGIRLYYSSNNRFWHNNFIDNPQQVDVEPPGYANVWDNGYPSGGNYWSDYTGADEKSGPSQDQPGSDGIGDNPYFITEDNQDRYPLMVPEHELVVSVTTPPFIKLGSSSSLAAIVTNKGSSEETNVELRLIINGTIANLTIIPILQPSDSYTLNYLWTPTVEGIYNVTAYAPPVPGEALTENNQQTAFVNVSAPEIVVSIVAPASLRVGTSSSLKAIVSNQGLSNETDVELWLLINGSIMNSKTISFLQAGDSYTLSYFWTPTVEGTYNVTAYARPVPGEASVENNQMTEFVTVTASAPPGVQVGVKTGDWIKIDYTITGWPSGTPYPEWLKVEFLGVEGTNATVRVTMHMSDGTEQNATVPVDVVAGGGAFQGLSGFVIPANCTTGDSIYMSGYGNVTIAGETKRTYAGASRTVVYASFSQYGTQLTYYWDKWTGVMVEASTTSGTMTGTGKATETNIWEAAPPAPFWMEWWLWTIVAVVIVALAGVYFLKKRKPPTPTAPTSATEST